jgi:hypothetical protein
MHVQPAVPSLDTAAAAGAAANQEQPYGQHSQTSTAPLEQQQEGRQGNGREFVSAENVCFLNLG